MMETIGYVTSRHGLKDNQYYIIVNCQRGLFWGCAEVYSWLFLTDFEQQ